MTKTLKLSRSGVAVQRGTYRFYNAGKYDGKGEDLYMFTCYGPADDTKRKGWRSLGCHSVYESQLQGNIKALEAIGYALETSREF